MSLSSEVSRDYFRTTAARSHRRTAGHYEAAARSLARGLGPFLPRAGARALDLGCGCGEFLYLLRQRGAEALVGIDLCEEELDEARHFVDARFVCGDVVASLAELPSESLDYVSALNFMEHVDRDSLVVLLKGIRRVLRPGGEAVFMVPNAMSPFGGSTRYWDITHQSAFTPNSIRQLAAFADFEAPEFREWGPRPHGLASATRYLLWQGVRLGIAAWFLVEAGSTRGGVYTMDMLARLRRPS